MGVGVDGGKAEPAAASAALAKRVTASQAVQTLAFWQLAGSFFTCGFSMSLRPRSMMRDRRPAITPSNAAMPLKRNTGASAN